MSARNSFIIASHLPRAGPSCPRALQRRSSSTTSTPWPGRAHLKPAVAPLPPPVPALYPMKVVLADGSTYTAYTTAPAPALYQLTRDPSNNPLWSPGSERVGTSGEEGRVGRFNRMFDMSSGVSDPVEAAAVEAPEGLAEAEGTEQAAPSRRGFKHTDLEWMSEGAKAETVSAKEMGSTKKVKGKKK